MKHFCKAKIPGVAGDGCAPAMEKSAKLFQEYWVHDYVENVKINGLIRACLGSYVGVGL